MTDAEIQAVVGFIRAWEPTAPEVAEPARGGGPWWQSDGAGSPTGSGRGGPPWMQNSNTSSQEGAVLPSGGNVPVVQPQSHQPGEQGFSNEDIPENQQPDQVEKPQGTSAGDHQPGEGSGPPWAREQTPEPWWRDLDWRVYAFVGASAGMALLMILFAWLGLRRLNLRN